MGPRHVQAFVFVVGIAAAGCQLFGSGPGADEREELRRQILQEVSEPFAESVDQCRTMAFGAKPCGGPGSYLVYSVGISDSATLAPLVERYNLLVAEYNREHGLYSDCALVMRPDTTLVDGVCQAAPTF